MAFYQRAKIGSLGYLLRLTGISVVRQNNTIKLV